MEHLFTKASRGKPNDGPRLSRTRHFLASFVLFALFWAYSLAPVFGAPPARFGDEKGKIGLKVPVVASANLATTLVSAVPAASGVVGNFDVTFKYTLTNTSGAGEILTNPQIGQNFFLSSLGSAFVGIVPGSVAFVGPTQGVNLLGTFNGNAQPFIFDGLSGVLNPGANVMVQVTIEMNPNAAGFDPTRSITGVFGGIVNQLPGPVAVPVGGFGPTVPVLIKDAHLTKEVIGCIPADPATIPGASGTEGNYVVTYRMTLKNTGNVNITSLQLFEGFDVGAEVLIGGPTQLAGPALAFDPGFDGLGTTTLLTGAPVAIPPDAVVAVRLIVEIDPDDPGATWPPNNFVDATYNSNVVGALPLGPQMDASDSGTDPESPNDAAPGGSAGGLASAREDDPTPVSIPDIRITKEVTACVPSASSIPGNLDVTFHFVVQNTGNVDLTAISVADILDPNLLPSFVGITTAPLVTNVDATSVPDAGPNYTGIYTGILGNTQRVVEDFNCIVEPGLGGGQSFEVTFTAEFDANADPNIAFNQALAGALATDENGDPVLDPVTGLQKVALDESDSGNAPLTDNPTAPGDGLADLVDAHPDFGVGVDDDADGHDAFDHPTPVPLPDIQMTKEVTNFVPSASCVPGNFDVTFHLIVQNTGNTALDMVDLEDDFATQLGGRFVGIVSADINEPISSALVNPTVNGGYDGGLTSIDVFDQTSGFLQPGEFLDIDIVAEINIEDGTAPCEMLNQAFVTARAGIQAVPLVALLDPILMPNGDEKIVEDLSDSGNLPEDFNNGAPGFTLDNSDDPTPISIEDIRTTVEVATVTPLDPAADGCSNEVTVCFNVKIKNTGNVALENVLADFELDAMLGLAAVANATIVQTAGPAATINAAYDGGIADDDLLLPGTTLLCGEQIDLLVCYQTDPVTALAPATVQAFSFNQALTVANLSDSGNNPDGLNDAAPGATLPCGPFDPTPVELPRIKSAKRQLASVPAASGVLGNFDVTFRIRIQNTGNVPLVNLGLVDDLAGQIGAATVVNPLIVAPFISTSGFLTTDPIFDPGFATLSSTMIFDGTSGQLEPGGFIEVDFTVEINANAGAACAGTNQATASGETEAGVVVTDLTDNGAFVLPNNGAGGCDDPTPIELPAIATTKEVTACVPVAAAGNCMNNWSVTFHYVVKNIGNVQLTAVDLFDDFAAEMGTAFQSVTAFAFTGATTGDPGAVAIGGPGTLFNNGILDCGEIYDFVLTVIIDPNAAGAPVPLLNQSRASGNAALLAGPVNVNDLSDSGNDPDTSNDLAPGATLGPLKFEDKTPVLVPSVGSSKEVTGVVPAASGIIGNFDVTFHVIVENTGNAPLDNLQVVDNLVLNPAVVGVVVMPFSAPPPAQTSTIDPIYEPGFAATGLIFDETSGLLMPGQRLDIEFTLEIDADVLCATPNQITARGRGLDGALNPLGKNASDLSDSGDDPLTSNPGQPGDTGGCDDPTPLELPSVHVTKEVVSAIQVADPTGCTNNYTVVFKYNIQNTGTVPLLSTSLFDQLNTATNLGAGFVSATSAVISGPATANAGYNGTAGGVSAITSTAPLNCGQTIMATITAIVNADLAAIQLSGFTQNQGLVAANWLPNHGLLAAGPLVTINDLTDSGNQPLTSNDGAPGATENTPATLENQREDDPTPVFLPKIKASKAVVNIVPAASCTIGNFDVEFSIRIRNTGNVPLNELRANDLNIPGVNWVSLVTAPYTTNFIAENPVLDPGFFHIFGNLFDGNNSQLNPDEELEVRFVVEMDADRICQPTNQVSVSGTFIHPTTGALIVVSDLSDGGTNPNAPNTGAAGNTGGCDDPTPIEVPSIQATKEVVSAVPVVDPTGCTNNYTVTFRHVVENTGSIPLTGVTYVDNLASAANLGGGFVSLVSNTAVGAGANGGYLGNNAVSLINPSNLACGAQIVITTVAVVNADLTPIDPPTNNQGLASGSGSTTATPPVVTVVSDLSDSGSDPESDNNAAPGATLTGTGECVREDDPTPVYLPKIKASKEVIACGPAASGTLGNMDVRIRFNLLNTGNVPLDNICLTDDIATQMGAATIVAVTYASHAGTASILPIIEPGYTGGAAPFDRIFDCTSGRMMPDQTVSVEMVYEINPNAAGFILPALNQATVTARALDFAFVPLGMNNPSDISDGGSDPNSSNAGAPGNTGGCNDKTPISLPQLFVAKEAIACVPSSPLLPGDFNYTFKIRIQNTGNVRLDNVVAIDDLAAQIMAAYVTMVTPPAVTAVNNAGGITATANAGYGGMGNLFTAAPNLLMPGGSFEVTFTARINPNALLPETNLSNQAAVSARGLHPNVPGGLIVNQVVNTPGTATPKPVNDLSDSGSIPESYNVGEPGDNSVPGDPLIGEDDPTPIEIPSVNVAKAVVNCVPVGDTEPGMFNLTFRINVENTGNIPLDSLRLEDAFTSLGLAYKGIVSAPKFVQPPLLWLWPGTFNPAYDGLANNQIFNNEFNLLQPGEKFSVEMTVKIDPNAMLPITAFCNQARATAAGVRFDGTRVFMPRDGVIPGTQKRTADLSDSGLVPESTNMNQRNDTGTHDDCTPIEVPSLNIAKYVTDIIKVPGEVPPGNARLTFEIKAENTGNVDLRFNQLVDDVRTQMGTTWLNFAPGGLPSYVTTGMMATTVPVANRPALNAGFTGLTGPGANIFSPVAGSGIIRPGQFVTIRMIVDLDPNKAGAPDPLKNQANGTSTGFIIDWTQVGTPVPTPSTVNGSLASNPPRTTFDLSDSGKVPESNNIGEPCDMGTHNDKTPFEIPFNLASKWEIPNAMGTMCAMSEVDGNVDITFLVKYVNVGNTWLTNLQVMDDLMMQFGPNFVQVINGGLDIREDLSNATELPSLNWAYNGKTNVNILTGDDGLLAPNEFFVVRVIAEINPNAPGTIKPYDNQAMIFGLAVREDGSKVFFPCTTNDFIWDDKTDAGELPETTGPGYPGDTGGSNDPYDFRLPMSTAFAQDITIYPNCQTGIDEYLIPYVDNHGGAVVMAHPQCGPIEWTSNFMGSLDWLPAKEYGCGCTGKWEIEWNAKDQCGHDVCHDAFVFIKDTAAPCWDMDPMDKVVVCGPGMTNSVQMWLDAVGGAWFFDNCSDGLDIWNDYNPANAPACDADGVLVTFWLRDACGNTSSRRANLRIIDENGPIFSSAPASVTIQCGAAIPAVPNVTATDDCSANPAITLVVTEVAGTCLNEKTITRTWTAKDNCGNTASISQTISIRDQTRPTFVTVPANLTIDCPAVPVFGTPTTTDNCNAAQVVVTFVDAVIAGTTCPAGYTVRRTWTATDACGNTRTVARTIKVNPGTGPQPLLAFGQMPADAMIGCGQAVTFGTATATTTCPGGAVNLTFSDQTIMGSCASNSKYIRTWTATDACGNVKTASQLVTQTPDQTAPVFTTVPADKVIACGDAVVFGTPVYSDNCSATAGLTITFSDASNAANCLQGQSLVTSRTWTVTDPCGNQSTAKQTITTLPFNAQMAFANVPVGQTIDCGQAVAFGAPTANSTCPGGSAMSFSDQVSGGGCQPTLHTRTWTATDGCGNLLKVSQTITVKADVIDPVLSNVPTDLFVDCSTMQPTVMPTATDNCSGATITFTVEVLGQNPCAVMMGNVAKIHWTATDACGNDSKAVTDAFVVNDVTSIAFISAPPAPHTYQCGETMVWEQPVCVSPCGAVSLTFSDAVSGDCATGKTVTRTWLAKDNCGNQQQCVHVQHFAPDAQAPVMSFASNNEIVECGDAVPTLAPDVTDNCSAATVQAISDIQNGNKLLRVWVATDGCGNTSTAVQTFLFQDSQAPTFTSIPQNQAIECGQPISFGTATAVDACGAPTVTFVDQTIAGACSGSYKIVRTWTAKDASNNTSKASATISVTDTQNPIWTAQPQNQTVSCDESIAFADPLATDCSGATVSFSDKLTQGGCTGEYVVTRTWIATDGCGHTAEAHASIVLVDDVAPTFDAATTQAQAMTFAAYQNWLPTVGVTDNCGLTALSAPQTQQIVENCQLSYWINWTATDDCGNTANATVKIDITDEDPILNADLMPTLVSKGETFTVTTSATGGAAPLQFMWTITGGNGWSIVAGEATPNPTITAGDGQATLVLSLTNGIGCVQTYTWPIEATTTGLGDGLEFEAAELYPVPTFDNVFVKFSMNERQSLLFQVHDEAGKLIIDQKVDASAGKNIVKLDMTQHAAGNYMLEIRTTERTITKPFVKQ